MDAHRDALEARHADDAVDRAVSAFGGTNRRANVELVSLAELSYATASEQTPLGEDEFKVVASGIVTGPRGVMRCHEVLAAAVT
jgi:hypothetical protein